MIIIANIDATLSLLLLVGILCGPQSEARPASTYWDRRASKLSNSSETGQQQGPTRAVNWNYYYVEQRYSPIIGDQSIDERLANTIRTSNLIRPFNYFANKFESPLSGLQNSHLERLAVGPEAKETLCSEHLIEMRALLAQMQEILELRGKNNGKATNHKLLEQHFRLAHLLDSFGRPESGLLMGRNYFLGSYLQCKGSQLLLSGRLVGARYCMANLNATKHLDASLKLAKMRLTRLEMAEDFLSVGVCLPESCHTRDFAKNKPLLKGLIDSQFELPASLYQDQHLELDSVFCELDEDSVLVKIPLSGRILLVFIATWIVVVVYSTCRTDRSSSTMTVCDRIMDCLSLRRSWDEFTGVGKRNFQGSEHRVSLDTLNPVKVVACALVVFGHSALVHAGYAMDTIRLFNEAQSDPRISLLFGSTVVVDTFYVITGIILTFVASKRLNTSREIQGEVIEEGKAAGPAETTIERFDRFLKQSVSLVLARYLRLIPLYFLVFWSKKSFMPIISSGPWWDHGYHKDTEAGSCREESWLTPFTFQAAYLPLSRQCIPQAWSVAGDLFFSFVTGPIIVLISSLPLLAASISILICIASNVSLLKALLTIDPESLNDLMNSSLIALSRLFKTKSTIYTAPHYRMFTILIGVLAGYALYHYSRATYESHQLRRWPRWFQGFATRASLWYIVFSLFVCPLVPLMDIRFLPIDAIISLHMATTNRILWSLSNAIIMLRMVTDWKDSYWNQMGAGKYWSTMNKLNFAILLIHLDLLKLDSYMQLTTYYYSFSAILRSFAFAYLFSMPLATILFVAFENPIDNLIKYAMGRK